MPVEELTRNTIVEGGADLVSDINAIMGSGATAVESEECEPTKINYIAEFHKTADHDYDSFFSGAVADTDKVEDLNKEIRRLQRKIDDKTAEIQGIYSKQYKKKYYPAEQTMILVYKDRNYQNHYYSVPSGQTISLDVFDSEDEYLRYDLDTKTGRCSVLGGYAYDLGGLIVKNYKYSISTDNKTCKLSLEDEDFFGFLEDVRVNSISGVWHGSRSMSRDVMRMNPSEFLSNLYGVNVKTDINLGQIRAYKENNASFETIIKLAPEEIRDSLLAIKCATPKQIHELIGISKNTYKEALSRGTIHEVYEIADLMSADKESIFKKSESDWLGLIDRCHAYEKDLDFYGIRYGKGSYYGTNRGSNYTGLIRILAKYYEDNRVIRDNYSFPKYIDYAVKGMIDQGYDTASAFLTELRDYLRMCDEGGIRPTLYSSMLKQTHDITARNHKLSVSAEMEEKFKEQYIDFNPFMTKDKKFIVIAPGCSKDVIQEGDDLNHCAGAYVKRVIDGECKIIFLRKKADESLVTLEVKGSQIVQARGEHNRNPYEDEISALKEFAEERDMELNY